MTAIPVNTWSLSELLPPATGERQGYVLSLGASRAEATPLDPSSLLSPPTPGTIGVLPVSAASAALWNSLPYDVAVLAGPVGQSAALLVPSDFRGLTVEAAWQRLLLLARTDASQAERSPSGGVQAGGGTFQWIVFPPLSATGAPAETPRLLPPTRSVANWLATAIDQCCARENLRTSPLAVSAISAGLLLLHDDLDASHQHSQRVEGRGDHTGDYWHALMHRREGDFGNSKYWFRRVGPHPVLAAVARDIKLMSAGGAIPAWDDWRVKLTSGGLNSFALVDFCECCAVDERSELAELARAIQWVEMIRLLEHSWQLAAV